MKNNYKNYRLAIVIIMALSIMILLLGGCGKKEASISGGVISDIAMSTAVDKHDRPLQPAIVFPTDTQKLYCSFKLAGFPADSKIRTEWVYLAGVTGVQNSENSSSLGQPLTYTIQQQTGTITGDGYTSISIEPPSLYDTSIELDASSDNISSPTWVAGNYKVVLYVGDEEKASTSFEIK
jgi:hypothetical protein